MIIKANSDITAFYSENDPKACAWLDALMSEGLITPGKIDDRSIEDIIPSDLAGYDRVHMFAGIGIWDYVLNQAGWGDRPVWTGSCPCQSFSPAGHRKGFADERHLWPAFFHHIVHAKPGFVPVFGEQVASRDGLAWFDLVQADLEGQGYACGAVDTCAAGFGAPHLRQRLYWVAHAPDAGWQGRQAESERAGELVLESDGMADRLADALCPGWPPRGSGSGDGSVAGSGGAELRAGPVNGFWEGADWLGCTDERWRAVEPGTFPLVVGLAGRVAMLSGYGNALVAPQATAFVEAVMEAIA